MGGRILSYFLLIMSLSYNFLIIHHHCSYRDIPIFKSKARFFKCYTHIILVIHSTSISQSKWWPREDSNPRMSGFRKPPLYPPELRGLLKKVRTSCFELRTFYISYLY